MLRNFFSKLPGITNFSELLETPQNARMFRTLSPQHVEHKRKKRRDEDHRPVYRRSYSFPSGRRRSDQILETSGNFPSICNQSAGFQRRSSSSRKPSKKSSKGQKTEQSVCYKSDEANNKEQFDTYETCEQYELEGSRPRQTPSQTSFNVFEYIENLEKEHDPMEYLQPSNLKPFGAANNTYTPVAIKMSSSPLSKEEDDKEKSVKGSKTQNAVSMQKREYSSEPWRISSSTQNLIHMLPLKLSKNPSRLSETKEELEDLPNYKKRSKSFSSPVAKLEYVYDNSDSKMRTLGLDLNESGIHAPRLAYSATQKNSKHLSRSHIPNKKTRSIQAVPASTDGLHSVNQAAFDKQKVSQNRTMFSKSFVLNQTASLTRNIASKKSLSSTALNQNKSHSTSNRNKHAKKSRPFEPESCEKPEAPRRCFLPSRIRLKPPKCTPKPPPCPQEDRCPPRADDSAVFAVKPLPLIKVNEDCPCINHAMPSENPKLRRLKFNFKDPPKICPIEGPVCPPRADDTLLDERKRLPLYQPKDCPCVEPPPMVDIPLRRLKKVCIPVEVCRPVRVCPVPEPCVRADDGLVEKHKELPVLKAPYCPCVIPPPKEEVPQLKRLDLDRPDPTRVCPKPCICEYDCPRADDTWKQLPKKLPKLIPQECPCVDTPIEDVKPLKRLDCIDEPEECYETDPCIEIPRADMGCWEYWVPEEKSKKGKNNVSHHSKRKYNTDATNYEARGLSKTVEPDVTTKDTRTDVSTVSKKSTRHLKNASKHTIELLTELGELDGAKSSVQVQNVRNLSSKPNSRKKSKKKGEKHEEESCVKPPNKCYKLDQGCPSLPLRHCPQARDPCNKACQHIRPGIVCNRKEAPYPAFSELLDDGIVPFTNSSECKSNERDFHYHLEEKKIPVPKKPSSGNSKCYSTLSSSNSVKHGEKIHRSQERSNHSIVNYPEKQNLCSANSDKLGEKCYHSESYNQRGVSSSSLQEKLNLTRPTSPNIQSSRLVSQMIKKTGIEAIKNPCDKNDKTCKVNPECPKLKAPNCPPLGKRLPSCRKEVPVVCQKLNAPFKAFTDCLAEMDDELADKLSECPLEANKIRYLQPDYVRTLDNSRMIPPVTPKVGKLDLTAEDDCVRRRLCMEKGGLSRSCCDLKKPYKPMRAKDLQKYKDELHKNEQDPSNYHEQTARSCKRRFCTWASNPLNFQRRGLGSSATVMNTRRDYHLLCKTQDRYLEEDLDERGKTVPHLVSKDHEDASKNKLRSVQWRVDNFQKWHRLNKLNSHSSPLKRFYSCPNILTANQRMYSTLGPNQHTSDDGFSCRNISTCNTENARQRCVDPTKIKLSKTFEKVTPSSEYYLNTINTIPECDYMQETFKRIQPDTVHFTERLVSEPYPNVGVIDYNLAREYKRYKYGIKNEGLTLDCNSFGMRGDDVVLTKASSDDCESKDTFHHTNECEKQLEVISNMPENCESTEKCLVGYPKLEEPTEKCLDECPKPEVFCLEEKVSNCPQPVLPIHPINTGENPNEMIRKECVKKQRDVCQKSFSSCDITNDASEAVPKKKYAMMDQGNCESMQKFDPCAKETDTFWQKILNYFKARPNCPPPDEWKKKALRAKAEKAAKAAGLILCDPKDFERMSECCKTELPKVVTAQWACENKEKLDDPCGSPKKNLDNCQELSEDPCAAPRQTLSNNQRRNFTTTTVCTVSEGKNLCDPLDIGQFLNKVVVAVPLDSGMLRTYRFPQIFNTLAHFSLQRDFLKHSTTSTITTIRYYSKQSDRKDQLTETLPKDENNKLSTRNAEDTKQTTEVKNEDDNIRGNDTNKYCESQQISPDLAEPEMCPKKYITSTKNFFDVIFPEDFIKNPDFHQAKALALFQEICNKLDFGTDLNTEEIEHLKTQHVLKELDKLLEKSPKPQKD